MLLLDCFQILSKIYIKMSPKSVAVMQSLFNMKEAKECVLPQYVQ